MLKTIELETGGVHIAATAAGDPSAPTIVLLHGWPHSRALYDGVIDLLGDDFFVLAMDLPAIGDSRGAPRSAEKSVLADIVIGAAEAAGARDIVVAGLDVGGMTAFAAARDHGSRIRGAIVMNTVIPGLEPWDKILADPRIWHFAFHGIPQLPETLVAGHERVYFDFFHNVLTRQPQRISDSLRTAFARAYARPEALKAGFDWYRAMAADAKHNAERARITTPLLYARGDADKRAIEPYLEGLRGAGVEALESRVIADCGELAPIEQPRAFSDIIADFAARHTAERSSRAHKHTRAPVNATAARRG